MDIREDIKKVFLVVGPLRFYPPYTNGLVVHAKWFFAYGSLPTPLLAVGPTTKKKNLFYVCLVK